MFRAHVLIIRRSELHYTASGIITPTSKFIKEFQVDGRCCPANCRAFSVILIALEKHRRVCRVCNWLPKFAGELVIRSGVSSFLNLRAGKRREVSFKAWTTLIKTKANWQSSFCIYIRSIFKKRVGDKGENLHKNWLWHSVNASDQIYVSSTLPIGYDAEWGTNPFGTL